MAANYFQTLKVWRLRMAVSKALQRKSPNSIPLSGWERLQGRNYFTVHLGDYDDPHVFLVEGISQNAFEGYWWNGDVRARFPASLPFTNVLGMTLTIKHYFRELEIDYRGASRFIVLQTLRGSWFRLRRHRLSKWLYNRKTLVRDERYQLLRNIYEKTIRDRSYSTSAMDYMTERYGVGWVGHPKNQEVRAYYGLVLDALSAAGDLTTNGTRYSLNPSALVTLSNHEEDNRRHDDATRLQKSLVALTFALVIVGLLQAFITLIG